MPTPNNALRYRGYAQRIGSSWAGCSLCRCLGGYPVLFEGILRQQLISSRLVHSYSRHGEIETVQRQERTDSEGRSRGRFVKLIRLIALLAVVMFPACVVRLLGDIKVTFLSSNVTNFCALYPVFSFAVFDPSASPWQPRPVSNYCRNGH